MPAPSPRAGIAGGRRPRAERARVFDSFSAAIATFTAGQVCLRGEWWPRFAASCAEFKLAAGPRTRSVNSTAATLTVSTAGAVPPLPNGGACLLPTTSDVFIATSSPCCPKARPSVGYQLTAPGRTLGYIISSIEATSSALEIRSTRSHPAQLPTSPGPGSPLGPGADRCLAGTDFWARG